MPTTARKKTTVSPAAKALQFVKDQAAAKATWVELNNALFGIGGKASELFPTPSDRTAFTKTPEFAEINAILAGLPQAGTALPEASGKLLLRLPKSLHAALILEADEEGTSVNQLVVAKLASQLKAVCHAGGKK